MVDELVSTLKVDLESLDGPLGPNRGRRVGKGLRVRAKTLTCGPSYLRG